MKRFFDLLSSFLLLVLFFLPFVFIGILILITSGFPILYWSERVGKSNKIFLMPKIRTMKRGTPQLASHLIDNADSFYTPLGKFLRQYSIDEIPQLFNVIFGDMSIVGPRPHMVEHDIKYSKLFMNYLKRHKCNPGLTGWAQVNGLRGSTSDEQMRKRMEHDLWYLNNWNIALDLYIIVKTFYAIFKFKGE